ncbi:DUF2806 domain-containing protein [Chryseobacterium nepalense]|uniref:DUF2806 domain-containing protein n=1 Tax=Chryseobacterium nepalense TaxID=1854498 RepID=UPI002DFD31F2|nr:hypothetical protein [Chryseobacterium nepalense]
MNNENLDEIKDVLIAINESTPPYIKQGFLKALDRLGSALIDIPVSKLERYAKENRAITETRSKIINSIGDSIGNKVETLKEYSDYSVEKYAKKILGRQINIDAIAVITAKNINNSAYVSEESSYKEISDEWLNEFSNIAEKKSSDDMRMIFGKILAKEVCQPGQVSIRSLHIISQLEKEVAISFQKFCAFCLKHIENGNITTAFAPTFGSGILNNFSFSKFDFPDYNISKLMDYGLINNATEFSYNFSSCIDDGRENFKSFAWFGNRNIKLKKTVNYKDQDKISIHALFLTDVGSNLFSIISTDPDVRILEKLEIYFEKNGLKLL